MDPITMMIALAIVGIIVLPYLIRLIRFLIKMSRLPTPETWSPLVPILGHLPKMLSEQKRLNMDPSTACLSILTDIVNRNVNIKDQGVWKFWLGPIPSVIITRAEAVEVLLKKPHLPKPPFYSMVTSEAGVVNGLVVSVGGPHWKAHRRLLTPAFHNKILEDFLPLMSRHTRLFHNDLRAKRTSEGIIEDLYGLIARCSFGILCESAMGTALLNGNVAVGYDYAGGESQFDRALSAFAEMQEMMFHRPTKPWLLIDPIYRLSPLSTKLTNLMEGTLFPIVMGIFNDRREKIREQYLEAVAKGEEIDDKKISSFLDILILENLKNPQQFTDKDVKDELLTFFAAGWDTISVASLWALVLVGHNPDIQQKILEELDSIFADNPEREITLEDLKDMKYTDAVCRESMRLYPTVPWMAREMDEDITVPLGKTGKEVVLPKGAYVISVIHLIHRNPDYWPDPLKFDPERFLSSDPERSAFSFIPFSAGHRNCLGARYTQIQMKYVVASFFRKFTLTSLVKMEDIKSSARITYKPETKIRILLEERGSAVKA